jgi:four helix bundle protein
MGTAANSDAMKSRTKQLALVVIRFCRTLPQNPETRIVSRQLLRSATSVAANYRAVCRARSTADFTSKLGLVLEEADETLFWLELLVDAGIVRRQQADTLLDEANQLVSIFVASLRTAKGLRSAICNLESAIVLPPL